jgi:Nucleoside-diphosphate-sugar epimerases
MRYVVFGATGFLGELLVKKLVERGDDVIAVARNEGKLIALKERFFGIDTIAGDIADSWTVATAFRNKPDGVFLLSAFKHVGMAETESMQCVKSNVIGTLKVLRASIESKPGFVVSLRRTRPRRFPGCTERRNSLARSCSRNLNG